MADPDRRAVERCGAGRRRHDRAAPGWARRGGRRTLMTSSPRHSSLYAATTPSRFTHSPRRVVDRYGPAPARGGAMKGRLPIHAAAATRIVLDAVTGRVWETQAGAASN